jgi:hypothetical protein
VAGSTKNWKQKTSDVYHKALLINSGYADAYLDLGNSIFHIGLIEGAKNA